MRCNPSAWATLAWMSNRKNSRSSTTSSPARKAWMAASTATPGFCQSRSAIGRHSCEFRKVEGQVEVLQRLGRRALEQVVLGGHHDQPASILRQGEPAELDVVAAGDAADPRGFVQDPDQGLAAIARVMALADFGKREWPGQMQVGGQGDATEMWRDVRHELDRVAEPARDLALVHVAGECVGHQVVAQLGRIVP